MGKGFSATKTTWIEKPPITPNQHDLLNCMCNKHRGTLLVIGSFFLTLRHTVYLCLIDCYCLLDLTSLFCEMSFMSILWEIKTKIEKEKFQELKTVKLKISRRRKSRLVVLCQVVTFQCCGLAVYFLWFHLTSDWLQNNEHSRNFLQCSRFYGKD